MTEEEIREIVLQVLHDEGADMQDSSLVPDATDSELESSAVTMPLLVGSGLDAAYKKALLSRIVNKINEYVLGNIDAQAIRQALPELDAEIEKAQNDADRYITDDMLNDYLNGVGGGATRGLRFVEVNGVRYVVYLMKDGRQVGYGVNMTAERDGSYLTYDESGYYGFKEKVIPYSSIASVDAAIKNVISTLGYSYSSNIGWQQSGNDNFTVSGRDSDDTSVTINTKTYSSPVVNLANGGIVGAKQLTGVIKGTETIITDITQL